MHFIFYMHYASSWLITFNIPAIIVINIHLESITSCKFQHHHRFKNAPKTLSLRTIENPLTSLLQDFEIYKQIYENVVLVGAGTYGSVYFVR